MDRSVFYGSREVWYQFIDAGDIGSLVGLGGKMEQRTRDRVHATVDISDWILR